MDEITNLALEAVRMDDPNEARLRLESLIERAPDRLDLRHSLAVTLIRMGEAKAARIVTKDAIAMAFEMQDQAAATLLSQLYMVDAEAALDLYLPHEAERAYKNILQDDPLNPYALQSYAYLLFRWGRLKNGMDALQQYLDAKTDEADALEGNQGFLQCVRKFIAEDVHPKELLNAHHGSYLEFFNYHAKNMAKEGWQAEQPYITGQDEATGKLIYYVREGDRPYATARADLIDPKTGQGGRVGDQPMIVALEGYEAMAHAPVLFPYPGHSFLIMVSSRVAWNNLAIHIRTLDGDWTEIDQLVGDWYQDGFHGSFGTNTSHFFHEISPPMVIDDNSVTYYMDCGRAGVEGIDNLLRRLEIAHDRFGIDCVIIGEGFLP